MMCVLSCEYIGTFMEQIELSEFVLHRHLPSNVTLFLILRHAFLCCWFQSQRTGSAACSTGLRTTWTLCSAWCTQHSARRRRCRRLRPPTTPARPHSTAATTRTRPPSTFTSPAAPARRTRTGASTASASGATCPGSADLVQELQGSA